MVVPQLQRVRLSPLCTVTARLCVLLKVGRGRGSRVLEPDTRVQDPAALAEIALFGEVVVAAAERDEPLSQVEIDRALGLPDAPER